MSEHTDNRRKKLLLAGTPLNIVINIICFCKIYGFNRGTRQPWSELPFRILSQCSYQDVERVGNKLAALCIIAVFVGIGGALLLNREFQRFSKIKKSLFLLMAVSLLGTWIEALKISQEGKEKIIISEVCRKMTYVIDDDASYVVIKNTGTLIYEIDTMYLTDKEDGEDGLPIQSVAIASGEEYQYIMAGDEGLGIKKKGGTIIYLMDKYNRITDSVTVPALEEMQSYKLIQNAWEIVNLPEKKTVLVSAPQFSDESGFYEDAFDLSISAEDGLRIYYTTDSSTPTESSFFYTSPIHIYDKSAEANSYRSVQNVYPYYLENEPIGQEPVDKCFVVRAVAVDEDGNKSDVVTKSYFVGLDEYKDSRVISLVSDPEDLFGEQGIYVTGSEYDKWYEDALNNTPEGEELDTTDMPLKNYSQHGAEWERLANMELFEKGEIINNQSVGIRIQGASAREGALKRFSIYSRKIYSGSKWFDVDFFDGIRSHSVDIREGDANAISQRLAANREAVNIPGKAVTLFLDGEYWYTAYIYEKLSEEYLSEYYGVNENNVIVSTFTKDTDTNSFEYLKDYVTSYDLAEEENYTKLSQMMDVQSYIDYWAINIYLGNMDVTELKNNVRWRTAIKENEEYGDMRWRWAFHDMDLLTEATRIIANVDTDAEVNSFKISGAYVPNAINEGVFWKALVVNPQFCRQFVLSFMDIVNTNFSLTNVEEVLEEYGYDISYNDYFFRERPKYMFQYLAEEFGLTGTQETVELSSNKSGSPVTLNTITPELSSDESWSGTYFTDYPVTVTASSPNFDHWEVTSGGETEIYSNTTIEVPVVKGGVEIHAVLR
jgi:hypothetical protein